MAGKQMEGNEEQRRKKAREARDEGKSASEAHGTTGGSQQRHHEEQDAGHREKIERIREGKQEVIRENTPEPRPGYARED